MRRVAGEILRPATSTPVRCLLAAGRGELSATLAQTKCTSRANIISLFYAVMCADSARALGSFTPRAGKARTIPQAAR